MTTNLDAHELHRRTAASFGTLVDRIDDDGWGLPTPCTEWDVRALVNHLVYDARWAPLTLGGATVEEVGDRFDGDLLGDDPVRAWHTAIGEATAAADATPLDRTVHLSFGDVPAEEYLLERATDLAVHGWDLARAIDVDATMDADVAATLLATWEPREAMIRAAGIFGDRVEVPAGASDQDRLLGLLGRRP